MQPKERPLVGVPNVEVLAKFDKCDRVCSVRWSPLHIAPDVEGSVRKSKVHAGDVGEKAGTANQCPTRSECPQE